MLAAAWSAAVHKCGGVMATLGRGSLCSVGLRLVTPLLPEGVKAGLIALTACVAT